MNVIPKLIDYSKQWGNWDVVIFTANQIVKKNGELVMGAGNAKAARDGVLAAAETFGKNLGEKRLHVEHFSNINLAALVTKQHFKDSSNLEFVKESLRELYKEAKSHPEHIFHLPYPAIGHGGLNRVDLDPIIEFMPENVLIYINPKIIRRT